MKEPRLESCGIGWIVTGSVLALVASGCGAEPAMETAVGGVETGVRGLLEFEASPVGQVHEGPNEIDLAVRDASTKAPAAGAALVVLAHMSAMGHEAPVRPELEEVAPGEFRVTNLVFTMPGRWLVEVDAAHAGRADEVMLGFDVP